MLGLVSREPSWIVYHLDREFTANPFCPYVCNRRVYIIMFISDLQNNLVALPHFIDVMAAPVNFHCSHIFFRVFTRTEVAMGVN